MSEDRTAAGILRRLQGHEVAPQARRPEPGPLRTAAAADGADKPARRKRAVAAEEAIARVIRGMR